jgi:patatin-related protein
MTGAPPTDPPPISPDQVPLEELRLALVLNGGVSLAVWMGGVAREIDLLVRSEPARHAGSAGPYGEVLSAARSTATVDVISGTSAGGINGACLAVSLANRNGRLDILRDLWAEQGRMDNLLRAPFRGQPTSLLRGDEYFLPELTRAVRGLITDFSPTSGYSVDLTITTTLLGGATALTTDGLGQQLPQRRHGANFRFSTKHPRTGHNDFDEAQIARTCDGLGLAARCSAGFPFAFEPSFVPVEMPTRGQAAPVRTVIGGRPNMWRWASWAERSRAAAEYPDQAEDLSRYAVDGGVLANTPTREALDAIDRRPAGSPLRRSMLLVFPHAPTYDPAADPPDRVADAPTVAGAVGGLLGSLTSQGSLTFVEQIDEHNRRAFGWRGGRERVLDTFSLDEIYRLVDTGWEFYASTRIQAAARSLSERVPRPEGWDFGRVVSASAEGQQVWRGRHERVLPYVPKVPLVRRRDDRPRGARRQPLATTPARTAGWGWGTTVALGVADAVAEMLFAAQSLVPEGEDLTRLVLAVERVSNARDAMLAARDEFDDWWWHQPAFLPVAPDAEYWALRLDAYHRAMEDDAAPEPPESWLADAVARLHDLDGNRLGDAEQKAVVAALQDTNRPNPIVAAGDTLGTRTTRAVMNVVAVLAVQAPRLRTLAPAGDVHSGLALWSKILDEEVLPGEPDNPTDRMLTRLLSLDAATWMLADAESTGTSRAVSLAQLSLVIDHWWATKSKTPDDKVAGNELNRFGGFLKQSWRINDWIWGRLDAAQMLCRLVLEPRRLCRIHELTGISGEDVVGTILDRAYGDVQGPPELAERRRRAVAEVNEVFNGRLKDRGYLPELAGLAAYPVQQQIIVVELPALARSIKADRVTGANKRSRGESFLQQESRLLEELDGGAPDLWRTHGERALAAFDRAGIGREPFDEESRSDAMIQTAVTAAATLVTVADSDGLGVKALKPVTKAVRGGALLPYWLVTGLLAGSGTARALALLGFAVGGLALLFGLFGLLGSFSAAGTTIGAGLVVGAFAFAALRSGTLLHGTALLGLALPLVLVAPRLGTTNESDAQGAAVSLTTVAIVVLGLIVLASLPNPIRSPAATLLDPKVWVLKLVGVLAVAAAVAALVSWWPESTWRSWYDDVGTGPAVACTVVVALAGLCAGWLRGRGMRRLTRQHETGTDDGWRWELEKHVSVPSGVSAGWSAVYGCLYLVLAWVAAWWISQHASQGRFAEAPTWQLATMTWWAVLGVVFCLAGPFWITWRARRTLAERIRRQAGTVQEVVSDDTFRDDLERRGQLFSYMVSRGTPPRLNLRAGRLKPEVVKRRAEAGGAAPPPARAGVDPPATP